MAFTTPKTWSFGEILTSTDMNTYVRDNTLFLSNRQGFTASAVITATDASWPVPTLSSPIVKVTVIGGGGGGGSDNAVGSAGGTTSFGTFLTAGGGAGGRQSANAAARNGINGTDGFSAGNAGSAGGRRLVTGGETYTYEGQAGNGGSISVSYVDLTAVSTVNVTIGAGGAGASGTSNTGGTGGRGEVIVEYVAG